MIVGLNKASKQPISMGVGFVDTLISSTLLTSIVVFVFPYPERFHRFHLSRMKIFVGASDETEG